MMWPRRMRRKTPGLDLVERQHQPLDRGLGGGDLGGRHLREVLLLQQLAVGHREPGVDLDVAGVALELAQPREQRVLDALRAGRGLSSSRGGACATSEAISLSR